MDKYTASADGVALSAGVAKTVVNIATPSTIRARVTGVQVSFDGVTAGNVPALVELMRQTSAGTVTAVTPVPSDSAAPASLATAGKNASAEPTGTTVIKSFKLSPNGGTAFVPLQGTDMITVPVSGFFGIRVTAANVVNVNAEINFLA